MKRDHGTRLQRAVDGMVIRGGTSKGFFVEPGAIPDDDGRRDERVLELFGTPDPLQVDGLGGSHTHTSKLMVVGPSERRDADLEYAYAQVGITNPTVDWSGNCGNLVSAVGAFGAYRGWIVPTEPTTTVRIYSRNTRSLVEQDVPVVDGEPNVYGDYQINGVPGTGARVESRYLDPAGGILGSLLPTGNAVDRLSVDGEEYEVSIVDATNVTVFLRAGALGVEGTELPPRFAEDRALLDRIERLRGAACVELGLVDDPADAARERPTMPFLALLSGPKTYEKTGGGRVEAGDVDVTARMFSTGTPHHAYAMTGATCLAAATRTPGTIAEEVARRRPGELVIGHPKGTSEVGVDAAETDEVGADAGVDIRSVSVSRTVRPLMTGTAYYRDLDRVGEA